MFEQHPVPQQISSYQFRLVGDMTLKQFFQLAGGAVLGLIVYATPLPVIFKWPLIILFVLAGAAFAFLPLQERPLEQWFSAFFRAVYGPTRFVWTKSTKDNPYFAPEEGVASTTPHETSAAPQEAHTSKLEETEKNILSRLTGMFTIPTRTTAPVTAVPSLQSSSPTTPIPASPPAMPQQAQATVTPVVISQQRAMPTPVVQEIARPVVTPQLKPVTIEQKTGADSYSTTPLTPLQNVQSGGTIHETLMPSVQQQSVSAQFSPEAAPPSPPTSPNIIVGQVMESTGKIVSGAILEIKDAQGRPMRALRTNQAGHFMIVTQLPSGQYKIFVEKEGLTFDPINLETKGEILPPIAIRSKNINA